MEHRRRRAMAWCLAAGLLGLLALVAVNVRRPGEIGTSADPPRAALGTSRIPGEPARPHQDRAEVHPPHDAAGVHLPDVVSAAEPGDDLVVRAIDDGTGCTVPDWSMRVAIADGPAVVMLAEAHAVRVPGALLRRAECLVVSASGYQSHSFTLPGSGSPQPMTVRLTPQPVLEVQIIDERTAAPVSGATVTAWGASAVSDESGLALLRGLATGHPVPVTAHSERDGLAGSGSGEIPQGTARGFLRLSLRAGSRLIVRVDGDRSPTGDSVRVTCSRADRVTRDAIECARTGPGVFECSGVAPGFVAVRVTATEFDDILLPAVPIDGPQCEIRCVLSAEPHCVAGQIVDERGTGVAAAEVSITDGTRSWSAQSGAGGEFEFRSLRRRVRTRLGADGIDVPLVIRATRQGHAECQLECRLDSTRLRIVLPRCGVVRARATTKDGRPASRVSVSIVGADGCVYLPVATGPGSGVVSDRDGSLSWDSAPRVRGLLQLSSEGAGVAQLGIDLCTVSTADLGTVTLRAQTEPLVGRVRVVGDDSDNVVGTVRAVCAADRNRTRATGLRGGRYVLRVEPGHYELELAAVGVLAVSPSAADWPVPGDAPADIEAVRTGGLEVWIGRDGSPATGARADLEYQGDFAWAYSTRRSQWARVSDDESLASSTAIADADGEARYRILPPGRYRVRVDGMQSDWIAVRPNEVARLTVVLPPTDARRR